MIDNVRPSLGRMAGVHRRAGGRLLPLRQRIACSPRINGTAGGELGFLPLSEIVVVEGALGRTNSGSGLEAIGPRKGQAAAGRIDVVAFRARDACCFGSTPWRSPSMV